VRYARKEQGRRAGGLLPAATQRQEQGGLPVAGSQHGSCRLLSHFVTFVPFVLLTGIASRALRVESLLLDRESRLNRRAVVKGRRPEGLRHGAPPTYPVFQRPLGSEYLWGDREDLAILRVPNTHLEGTFRTPT
jgi:hypothetical protein